MTQGLNSSAAFAQLLGDVNRPDEAKRYAPSSLAVSGAEAGGRLIVTFTAPPITGALPTTNPDVMCDPPQSVFFFVPMNADAGAGGAWTTGTLTVSDGGVEADGGVRTILSVTQLAPTWFSGPLPDRTFDLVLP
jgi:hypothetical protein